MLAGLAPFWASAGAAGCGVQCLRRRAPETLARILRLRRFLVAVLRILGVRSTPSSPGSASSTGGYSQFTPAGVRCSRSNSHWVQKPIVILNYIN